MVSPLGVRSYGKNNIRPSESFQTACILNQYLFIKNAAVFANVHPLNDLKFLLIALWLHRASDAADVGWLLPFLKNKLTAQARLFVGVCCCRLTALPAYFF